MNMNIINTISEQDKLRENGRIVALVHQELKKIIKAGITTLEIDKVAEKVIRAEGALPAFKNYKGFPFCCCISVNEVIVHGYPNDKPLKSGDLITVDVGTYKEGFYGDAAFTVIVDDSKFILPSKDIKIKRKLIKISELALDMAINYIKDGVTTGTIGCIIEATAQQFGFSVIRNYVGHGIARNLHEDPAIYNYGRPGKGVKLKTGMCICIEPMLVVGSPDNHRLEDGWGVVTNDGSLSAHVEHQVIVHKDRGEIITKL